MAPKQSSERHEGATHLKILGHATPEFRGSGVYVVQVDPIYATTATVGQEEIERESHKHSVGGADG